MKRAKRLYVMLGVLVVLCAATYAVWHTEEEKEQIRSSGEIILSVPADEVVSLSWECGENDLSFQKGETWSYDGDAAFPVDEEKINEMLGQFEQLGVSFVIEEVTDYGMYGLDDPAGVIHFSTQDQSYEIQLGDFSSMDEERYLSLGDGNVYLAKEDPLEVFDVGLSDVIDNDEPLSYSEISSIDFSGADSYTITYGEENPAAVRDGDVYFTQRDGETRPLDSDRVEDYLDQLSSLDLTDYVTYKVTQEELADYGLDDPELTVEVACTQEEDGQSQMSAFCLSISRDPQELAAAEEEDQAGEETQADQDDVQEESITAYARVGDSPIVYRIDQETYEALLASSYTDLRHREVLGADFAQANRLDITLDDVFYTFTAQGEGEERVWTDQDGEEIAMDDLQDALEGLAAASAEDFVTQSPTGREEIRLTVYLDNEALPQTQIVLYRQDGTDCLAWVDGASFALVSRADVVALVEAVNEIVL